MKVSKKIAIILFIVMIFFIFTKIISNAQTATIITETLRLRREPTTDSKIVDLISEDEKVEILESNVGDDKNWYKVKYKNNTGYVYGEFIKIDKSNVTTPKNTTTNNTIQNNTTTNNITNTNVKNETNSTVNTTTIVNNVIENTIENNETNINNTTVVEPENTNIDETNKNSIELNTDKTVKENTEIYIIPLINAKKIYTVKPEEKIYVMQILNGWAYVKNDNTSGWIRCSELI